MIEAKLPEGLSSSQLKEFDGVTEAEESRVTFVQELKPLVQNEI